MGKRTRILSGILLLFVMVSLAGCATKKAQSGRTYTEPEEKRLLTNWYAEDAELGTPERSLDPAQVYAGLDYRPEMFYGNHELAREAQMEEFRENASYRPYSAEHRYRYSKVGAEERLLSTLPCEIQAGPGTLYTLNPEARIEGYHWMMATFLEKKDEDSKALTTSLFFAFDVSGDKLRMRMLKSVELDPETKDPLSYEFGDLVLEYAFSFRGRFLTLSDGAGSVTLETGRVGIDGENIWFLLNGKTAPGEARIDDIERILITYDTRNDDETVSFIFAAGVHTEGMNYCAEVTEDGLVTFTIPYQDGAKTYQFVYFPLENDGVILTDGENGYFYHHWFGDYYTEKLGDVLGDQVDPTSLSEEQADRLIQTQERLIEELNDSFRENNVSAELNEQTGRVTLDAGILFESDSAELLPEGRAYLEQFVKAYAPVILSGGDTDSVVQILIEGHTDPEGGYDYNKTLSERRAQTVADACVALEPGLAPYIAVKGCASDEPVLLSDGSVDMAASRRVVFKFILNP